MPNTKNAIGYPTEEGGFQEMGNTAPKVNMTADDISYDNSQSGASATNVQAAVDEAFSDLSELVKYQTTEAQIPSIPANSKGNYRIDPTIPTGYEIKDISVVSMDTMDTDVVPYIHVASGLIYVYARNHGTGAVSNQGFKVYLTYGKTGS